MKKILLDDKEVSTLVPDSLPMLIHGEDESGASLYTICLAAKWFQQKHHILFLCGYTLAEEEFAHQVGKSYENVTFYTREHVEEFINTLKKGVSARTIVLVKNIELFDEKLIHSLNDIDNLIISGNIEKSDIRDEVVKKEFSTSIYFSPLLGIELPELEKYQGFVVSGDYRGITQLQ